MKKRKHIPLIDLHKFVVEQLNLRKGDWQKISDATSVPYFTMSKIATGATGDPRVSSCQRLADYFIANPKDLAA